MKKLITLLIWAMIASGCDLFKPKPVNIDGLGFLPLIKNQQFNDEQFTKVIKTIVQQKQINDDDAQAMLEIYQNNGIKFVNASGSSVDSADVFSGRDVERFLKLLALHPDLNDKTRQTTQAIIVDKIIYSAVFDKNIEDDVAGFSGNLTGIYIVAYQSATNDKDAKRAILNNRQDDNIYAVVQGFEQAAQDIIENKRTNLTVERKTQAEQFLKDLKTYNDALPADARILDANNRLINPARMTDQQQTKLNALFGVGTGLDYRMRLSERMRQTHDTLTIYTQAQIK